MDQVTASVPATGCIKQWFLDVSEITDSARIFPRIIIGLFAYLVWDTWLWYTHLPLAARTTDTTAFTGAVFGMATVAASLYMQGGRDWDKLEELKNVRRN